MAGAKVKIEFEVHLDAYEMLTRITELYGLPDASKALRCLLDYATTDGDWDEIFKTVRCRRCGPSRRVAASESSRGRLSGIRAASTTPP
jgi:hypothetical protein